MTTPEFAVQGRKIGRGHKPLVIAEIGINHEGSIDKAIQMVDDAKAAGCECVKFQYHVVEDEMIPNDVVPGNATVSIWDIMRRCALADHEEQRLKAYVEQQRLMYLSTPFSRAAADRLQLMGVGWYKIGSGECNNYPLVRHIAGFGKPVIMSTGMNDLTSIGRSVEIFREHCLPYALLHCTSMYPTPYDKVRLGGIADLAEAFPDAVIGLSDHSIGNYTCVAAVGLGAAILEKHFTSDMKWPGPDISISIDPSGLADLVRGASAVHAALGGHKTVLPEEQPTIDFAYACVVTTRPVAAGDAFDASNIWVKRPGTGEIKAKGYDLVLGRRATRDIEANTQVSWADVEGGDKLR